jgi:uncharacterized protein (TIGR03067 family)
MRLRLFVLLTIGLSVAAAAPKEDSLKAEQAKFQGAWKVVSLELSGAQAPADDIKNLKFEFKGDKVIFSDGKETHEGTFKIDPTAKPKTFDLIPSDGPEKGKTEPGIYTFEGDTLKICGADPGKDRPKDFTTKQGSGLTLVVLKRAK